MKPQPIMEQIKIVLILIFLFAIITACLSWSFLKMVAVIKGIFS
jgi:hypothetical protein